MLVGTLRRGSGMIGLGGASGVVAVGVGALRASLICVPSRPFGAGFGTGTVCADKGAANATTVAAIRSRASTPVTRDADRSADRVSELLGTARSCLFWAILQCFDAGRYRFFRDRPEFHPRPL